MTGTEAAPLPLVAILTCRNAAPTLARHLDHLKRIGAEAIVIDHGSTDATREIVLDRLGGTVREIVDEPFTGVFDLTRQLQLKREIIRGLGDAWVLHADVDEFVDLPDGAELFALFEAWERRGVKAAACDEFLFLPRSEAKRHEPATFEETMRHYVPFREHDPKQRVFRSSACLRLWMRTGGHTITQAPSEIAPERFRLRHYFGLSLDQIRSEYLSRVVAPRDIAKGWHDSRRPAERFNICPPPEGVLRSVDEGWSHAQPLARLPVFAERPEVNVAARSDEDHADLVVTGVPGAALRDVLRQIDTRFGGLRIGPPARPIPGGPTVLGLIAHPATGAPTDEAGQVRHAEAWLRHVTLMRQAALAGGARYRELRIEDLHEAPELLVATISTLLTGPPGRAWEAFLTLEGRPREADPYPLRIRYIAGTMARDLGYA